MDYKTNYKRLEEAKKRFEGLKLELSVRENNEHVGTGMGGNPSELLFLLSHKVKVEVAGGVRSYFSDTGPGQISFFFAEISKMKEIRQELTTFINSHPDKISITPAQLANISFLRDQKNQTLEIQLLIRALEEAYSLVSYLDPKAELKKQISETFDREYKGIEALFLKEMNLPLSYFKDMEDLEDKSEQYDDPMRSILDKHPVWGVRLSVISKRHTEMENQLLSKEDTDRLEIIGSMPSYIAVVAMRSVVQIERLVNFNLDEHERCGFLTTINKKMDK